MDAKFSIIADSVTVNADRMQSALDDIEDINAQQVGERMGIGGVINALEWIVQFAGNIPEIADRIIGAVESQLAGASIKLKFGNMEVEISNASRGQIIEILQTAQQMAQPAG